jgi:hypothetical protein
MNTMNMPGFTGEASFYKTTQFYRGTGSRPPGAAGPTVVAQLGCRDSCYAALGICAAGCGLNAFCEAGCLAGFALCVDACPPPGGVGGSRRCCPSGTVCDGGCVKVPGQGLVCEGECIGPGRPGEE